MEGAYLQNCDKYMYEFPASNQLISLYCQGLLTTATAHTHEQGPVLSVCLQSWGRMGVAEGISTLESTEMGLKTFWVTLLLLTLNILSKCIV